MCWMGLPVHPRWGLRGVAGRMARQEGGVKGLRKVRRKALCRSVALPLCQDCRATGTEGAVATVTGTT
ncbi:hypothetical protein SAMN00790413_03770 [Deinococcus hopiensis KR-140]|uniref:Uncharacterized protein n=1 Tax=Deinococcus hopiensis KR-140 TaxID=695939 RepID=A0A1W1UZ32_9DEIO|nr:hypothetical protein SAMN00790413_03770 [Deinococcus hopiensis KR-140]